MWVDGVAFLRESCVHKRDPVPVHATVRSACNRTGIPAAVDWKCRFPQHIRTIRDRGKGWSAHMPLEADSSSHNGLMVHDV